MVSLSVALSLNQVYYVIITVIKRIRPSFDVRINLIPPIEPL
jgi:hypothetical protein